MPRPENKIKQDTFLTPFSCLIFNVSKEDEKYQKIIKIMEFSGEQLTAILKLGTLMIAADGKITDEEKESLLGELFRFNVPPEKAAIMFIAAQEMETPDSTMIISHLSLEQKKYVTGYLAMLMTSDGDIDDSELKLWRIVSSLCQLPIMTIKEAVNFLNNN